MFFSDEKDGDLCPPPTPVCHRHAKSAQNSLGFNLFVGKYVTLHSFVSISITLGGAGGEIKQSFLK